MLVRARRGVATPVAVRRADGTLVTVADLPQPGARWTALRKGLVLDCMDLGLLDPDAAAARYELSAEEVAEWRGLVADGGRTPVLWPVRPRRIIGGTLRFGAAEIDLDARALRGRGGEVPLSGSEWTVVSAIAEGGGAIVTSAMVMGALYPAGRRAAGSKIVDVLVCRLRRKLGADGGRIAAVWGRGYRLVRD